MDLNKEIKLSDLFRRGKGPAEEDRAKEEKPAKEQKPRKSFSFSRAEKEPKEPKAPKAPKEKASVSPKAAPAPPAVPLMRAFDLMPKEGEREKTSTSPAFLKVVVALVAVVVLAGLAGAFMLMDGRAKEKQSAVDDVRAQLAELTAQAASDQEPSVAELTVEGQARTAALSEALAARVAWDRILREFSLVIPEGVWLSTLSSSSPSAAAAAAGAPPTTPTGEASFSIEGRATSQSEVARLLTRLEVIPEFSSVTLQSSARNVAGDAEGAPASSNPLEVNFTIQATIAPQGVPAQ
jgi:Tfp pilus assembly protein PilN